MRSFGCKLDSLMFYQKTIYIEHKTNKKQTRLTALIQFNRHQKRTIHLQLTASLSLLLSLIFPLIISLYLLWSIALVGYKCKSFISLYTTSLLVLPLCRAPSTFKVTHFHQIMKIIFKTCPYHGNIFLCTTFTMSSIPNHQLNSIQPH